jgi:two-component system C4-dicarboxylate transport sensor histidine kinase DctB
MSLASNKTSIFLIIIGLCCAIALILVSAYLITSNIAEQRLKANADFYLQRLSASLDSTLAKHIYLPKVIAQHSGLSQFLATADSASKEQILSVNQYLSKVNSLAQTSYIYLMLPNGETIASSNWDKENSFVGKNFSFRPYFIQAMQNRLGRYYARGAVTQQRGYYFASPVLLPSAKNKIVGILVVKITIGEIENSWKNPLIDFMVTDPNGVVFIASQQDWRFHSLQPLSAKIAQQLKDTRQYGAKDIYPLKLRIEQQNTDHSLVSKNKKHYFMVDKFIDSAGWHIYVLLDKKEHRSFIFWSMVAVLLTSLLSTALILLMIQRQRERRRYEIHAREVLEKKVAERTKELKLIQQELIHAGKMAALGQLSASINHELNNPLAAIRTYADNALLFLEKDQVDNGAKNLQKISLLTERMAAITHQLKSFSRKSQGVIEPISLYLALESSLAILKPQIAKLGVVIDRVVEEEKITVLADQVWIEQILINLLKNALDAVEGVQHKKLTIRVVIKENKALISISDNGKGLASDQIEHVFEPFFTTKKSSKGLGLGLSISYRLAKDMQGELSAENHRDGGATFLLTLPIVFLDANNFYKNF